MARRIRIASQGRRDPARKVDRSWMEARMKEGIQNVEAYVRKAGRS